MLTTIRGAKVGVTGATGYLGAALLWYFAGQECGTVAFSSGSGGGQLPDETEIRRFDLTSQAPPDLSDVDVLIHCAHAVRSTQQRHWSVDDDLNLVGARRLFEWGRAAGVGSIILISSIAAFDGTKQRYGRVKLALEQMAQSFTAMSIRPGLIYGPHPGGTVGALDRLAAKAPFLPSFSVDPVQYVVHIDDLVVAIGRLAHNPRTEPVAVCAPEPVTFRDLLAVLAARHDRSPRFIRLPWKPLYATLRLVETVGMTMPFRADSLWGLCHPIPTPDLTALEDLGIPVRSFGIF